MTQSAESEEIRADWTDYNKRQEFEHGLINNKTTWLLTTQALLFAAYGVTFQHSSTDPEIAVFRAIVALSGASLALVTLVGVLALIYSKYRSWRTYRDFYLGPPTVELPGPLKYNPLEWGVYTANTVVTLVPDVLIPVVFIAAWSFLVPSLGVTG